MFLAVLLIVGIGLLHGSIEASRSVAVTSMHSPT